MSIYDKFKPTPLSTTKDRQSEVAAITNQYDNDNSDRLKRVQISKDGAYVVRMYPAHPAEGATATEPKVIYFLPGMVNKKDSDGKWIKKEDGNYERVKGIRPVFNAQVHGGSDYDLVDTYISLAHKKADALYPNPEDAEDKKKYLLPIVGSFSAGSKHKGINPIRSFVLYGEQIIGSGDNQKREFAEFEIKPSVQKQLQKIAAVEAGDDPLGTDGCFTDVEDGRPFKVVVDSVSARAANDPSLYYSASILNETTREKINGKSVQVLKSYPISEEDLEKFMKVDPLIDYRTKFKWTDLKAQLEGLQMFDEDHGFGILEEDEFKEVYNYLNEKFPEEDEENESQEEDSSDNQDAFDLMDEKELKEYIKTNKLGIVVLPKYSEDDLREMIRQVENGDDEQEDGGSTEKENDEEGEDIQARLAKLRGKISS